jgi:hypothetical protein
MKWHTIEFIPNGFPKDYTMRSEYIWHGIKAIVAIGLIVFIGFVMIYGAACIWGRP